jgi:hypothetical protein
VYIMAKKVSQNLSSVEYLNIVPPCLPCDVMEEEHV